MRAPTKFKKPIKTSAKTGENSSEIFDFPEEALNQMPLFINMLIIIDLFQNCQMRKKWYKFKSMRYEQVKELDNEKFRRLTGVKKATFERMIEILDEEDRRKKAKSGRKSKLCREDRLLMALD